MSFLALSSDAVSSHTKTDDLMTYKDKESTFMQLIRHSYARLVRLDQRRYIILLVLLVVFVYFYQLSSYVYIFGSDPERRSAYMDETNEFNQYIQIQRAKSNDGSSSVIIGALIKSISSQDELEDKPIYTLVKPFVNGMYLYDMSEPIESWWPFDCIETRMKASVNTKLCIHDPKFDKYISGQLKTNGLWEPTNVRTFLRTLKEVPTANVIDIGANIGLYSLLSAKLNRTVLAVEPLHDNLNRIHKAAQMERVQSKIYALVNAVSNERKPLKLSIMDYNIGGSHVAEYEMMDEEERLSMTSSSVIVNSILLDDLLDVYRIKMASLGNQGAKKFVIKLDIEGYEPFAFEKGENLFKKLEIVAVFMEMGKISEKVRKINRASYDLYLAKVNNMFRILQELNYEPYEVNGYNKLDYSKWRDDWPWDVYFRQCDLLNCPGHFYKVSGV